MEYFDWQKAIKPNILGLKIVGLWPENFELFKCTPYSLYALLTACITVGGHTISQIINIYFVYSDLEALTEMIFIAVTNFEAAAKIYFYVRNLKLVGQLFATLKTAQFQPKSLTQVELVTRALKFWRMVYFCYTSMVYIIVTSWCLTPVLINEVKLYRLPFPAWFPFNYKKSPNYELTYLYQLICIWPITIANISLDTLILAVMVFTRAQCDILCDDLKNLGDEETFNEKLIDCIKHHKAILNFAKNSNDFFNLIVLGQLATSTSVLALTMFELSLVSPVSSKGISHILYITGLTVQILSYCKYGNDVEVKSGELVYAIYQSKWFELPEKVKRNLIIMAIRCQKPIQFTAISLFTLSLQTFISIFRTAWSYYALLHRVNSEEQ